MSKALTASWQDVWLLDGVRTPFVDYNGALAQISPIDLGIKAATIAHPWNRDLCETEDVICGADWTELPAVGASRGPATEVAHAVSAAATARASPPTALRRVTAG